MKHIIHREDSSDSIYQILANETHLNTNTKRIITACPINNKSFHIMKVIDRIPGEKQLKYYNVLANSSISMDNAEAAAMTRTMNVLHRQRH